MRRKQLLIILLLLLVSCGPSSFAQQTTPNPPIKVAATVGMIADVIKHVGGEHVEVLGLMGPGVDPHLYKPSVGDVRILDDAEMVFYGGLELEGRMTDMLEKLNRQKPTIAVTSKLDPSRLHSTGNDSYDPHIWFDVLLWRDTIGVIAETLASYDPAHAADYERNAAAYAQELTTLDQEIRDLITTVPASSRVLITAHDAFGYFGSAYGFEVRGLQGLSTASEAGAGDVQGLAEFIQTRQIKAIFVESSVPQTTINAVQKAVQSRGWNVAIGGELFSDAMGNAGTEEGTYIGMVRHNITTIVNALK
ncbi:metal ABC transporter solute-binding protein, Zn/Mn family [Herpetosiphon giganteus]|uniref:metal ABC transporter solute-binding protein, Zn/Mn family n=1 Tax=Herpetosiphon giganteus TaxID=2029754 RepID=UPI00195E6E0E|nr:zinc ABC transporter substrate-binding protein [Herpetosiphon giganteus]MBM7843977.1 manganese/zinc/iron transport system substrate-binding protein [Herpetosiphon giganteus]